jgi:hypothetical protein
MAFNPFNWYWLADDGRIFSSLQQAQVPATDQDYTDFCQVNQPTPWPYDSQGAQTDASLQDVLEQHGTIFANNTYYAAYQRWLAECGGITITGIASAPNGMPIKTDDRSKNLVGLAASAALGDSKFTTVWAAADWNTYAMTNAEVISMAEQMYQHIHDAFIAYDNAVGALKRDEIKGRRDIDELFARVRRK